MATSVKMHCKLKELDQSFANHDLAIRHLASLFPEEPFWNTFSEVRSLNVPLLSLEEVLYLTF